MVLVAVLFYFGVCKISRKKFSRSKIEEAEESQHFPIIHFAPKTALKSLRVKYFFPSQVTTIVTAKL